MKKIIFVSLLLVTLFNATSQNWTTDLEEAKQIASQNKKQIVLVFQGSDWCAPCIKLERNIWSTEEFKAYANDNYVMLKADFPRKKKNALSETQQDKNNKLAEMYNKNGHFPLVVILDSTGKILGETGYIKTSPNNYITHINTFTK